MGLEPQIFTDLHRLEAVRERCGQRRALASFRAPPRLGMPDHGVPIRLKHIAFVAFIVLLNGKATIL